MPHLQVRTSLCVQLLQLLHRSVYTSSELAHTSALTPALVYCRAPITTVRRYGRCSKKALLGGWACLRASAPALLAPAAVTAFRHVMSEHNPPNAHTCRRPPFGADLHDRKHMDKCGRELEQLRKQLAAAPKEAQKHLADAEAAAADASGAISVERFQAALQKALSGTDKILKGLKTLADACSRCGSVCKSWLMHAAAAAAATAGAAALASVMGHSLWPPHLRAFDAIARPQQEPQAARL